MFSTASRILSRYEQLLGLEVDVSKPDSFRRERIRAKISGVGTTTKEMVKNVASNYSNGEVEVIEDTSHYRFVIRFVGMLGIPGNMADLKLTIEDIKPAHLAVEYEYIYNTWENVKVLTWEQAAAYTWGRDKDGELMNVTENYGLKKPEKNEYISVDVINENIDAIDTELKKKD